MEFLNEFLPILLYIAGIVALIVLIILGIKAIRVLNQVEEVMDDVQDIVDGVQEKIDSFDGAFSVLSKVANGFAGVGSSIVAAVSGVISKIINRKSKEDEDYE